MNEAAQPSLYSELAPWFHLLTSPDDYGDEAAQALSLFTETLGEPPRRSWSSAAAAGTTPRT